jgi:hypothetical protein
MAQKVGWLVTLLNWLPRRSRLLCVKGCGDGKRPCFYVVSKMNVSVQKFQAHWGFVGEWQTMRKSDCQSGTNSVFTTSILKAPDLIVEYKQKARANV